MLYETTTKSRSVVFSNQNSTETLLAAIQIICNILRRAGLPIRRLLANLVGTRGFREREGCVSTATAQPQRCSHDGRNRQRDHYDESVTSKARQIVF
jgi:hypothetical protein